MRLRTYRTHLDSDAITDCAMIDSLLGWEMCMTSTRTRRSSCAPISGRSLHIYPASGREPEHLAYFKSIGGLVVFHPRCVLQVVAGFYKMALSKNVKLKGPEAVDYELCKDLTWMLCVPIVAAVAVLDTSQGERHNGWALGDVLCDGRPLWRVCRRQAPAYRRYTRANKDQYANLIIAHRMAA